MTLPATTQLAAALHRAGYTETELGRYLAPGSPTSTCYRAGSRLLSGSHVPDLERLASFARASGRTIAIGPSGVVLT